MIVLFANARHEQEQRRIAGLPPHAVCSLDRPLVGHEVEIVFASRFGTASTQLLITVTDRAVGTGQLDSDRTLCGRIDRVQLGEADRDRLQQAGIASLLKRPCSLIGACQYVPRSHEYALLTVNQLCQHRHLRVDLATNGQSRPSFVYVFSHVVATWRIYDPITRTDVAKSRDK